VLDCFSKPRSTDGVEGCGLASGGQQQPGIGGRVVVVEGDGEPLRAVEDGIENVPF
jgi:hypothetical protein